MHLDDVVQALGQKMKGRTDEMKSRSPIDHNISGELVLTDDVWLQNQPKETVLLFPGAEVSQSKQTQIQHREVVHCDGCRLVIEGSIFCCKTCFDYDLCPTCYPTAMLLHADGKHEFRIEKCDQ